MMEYVVYVREDTSLNSEDEETKKEETKLEETKKEETKYE